MAAAREAAGRRLALSVQGGTVRCLEAGSGPPALFLHGIPDGAEAWSDLTARLAGAFRCLAPDLPGFGESAVPPQFEARLESMADYVDGVVAAAGVEQRLTLAVHDVGGAFGFAWAVRSPSRVRAIIVLNTSFFSDRRWHAGARLLRVPLAGELAMRLLPKRAFVASVRRASAGNLSDAAIERTFARFGPDARHAAIRLYRALDARMFRGWEDRLADLARRVPILVVWGDRDPYLPVSFAERFGARSVRHLADCGHWPHREAPARVADAIMGFERAAGTPSRAGVVQGRRAAYR